MRPNRTRVVLCCLALGALLVVGAVQAQVLGTIQGFITDSNGSPLPGVTVTIRNQDTGTERTVMTDEDGYYLASALQSGTYSVTGALEGLQTVRQENIPLQLGQVLDINLELGVETQTEVITVTAEAPVIEVSRSSAASYVGEVEIESLPIVGRDFKEFALLTPTVQNDPVRGFITMSGQRGIYSGLNIDGTDAKSAFFGYGRGGEATENDGLVVAQDSVKEFQVITNGFAPEYGENSGGYINVVTKSGTNTLKGNVFAFYRDESLVEDIPSSPLDKFRGVDGSRPQDAFERKNWGVSIGGPIKKDRTHFFFAYDQTERDQPFTRSLRTPGVYDAVIQMSSQIPGIDQLVSGFTRNPDGTATGLFLRSVDNLILFGKLDHQFNPSHQGSIRVNYTDYERSSTFLDEESAKLEDTNSIVASLVSVIGNNAVNDARVQFATDNLDRLSKRVGTQVEAQIRFRFGGRDSVGKFDFLPILVEESKTQFQDNFSYLFGQHDLKFGVNYQEDNLKQLFAGSKDGRYDFGSIEDFLANRPFNVRIYFGNVNFPNYDETQSITALYAQDSWKAGDNLTVNFGLRWQATDNPGNIPHLLPQGRDIPDDTDNIAPRLGIAWSPSEGSVFRAGVGLFFGRTPTLLFASQVQENGLFPNFGRVNVRPGQNGFVPLGVPIDNFNPPAGTIPSTSYVDPSFEDPETWRLNVGYEDQVAGDWVWSADLIYAETDKLQTNVDLNRTIERIDEAGRFIYADDRPIDGLQTIFVRRSIGESEYTAATLGIRKRYNGRYSVNAHYTWSQDKDTDSNERSATSVTISNAGLDANGNLVERPRDDWGLSDRDVENRIVVSGLVMLPYGFKLSGIAEYRDGTPYSAQSAVFNPQNTPGGGTFARAVVNGVWLERNSFRNESVQRLDLRIAKIFSLGERFDFELFGEVFNLFNENSFEVERGQLVIVDRDGAPNPEFGIPDRLITDPRQFQFGARFTF